MEPAGLLAFEQRKGYDSKTLDAIAAKTIRLDRKIENSLKANQKAWDNFNNLAPGYRKQYVAWLQSAKKEETRARRLIEAIGLLENNRKLGMK
jgi:uncharacterized protein YdeI (YjbR/CyaY-like superfamily)